jgi:hypothetical protein
MESKVVEIKITPEPSALERQIIESAVAQLKIKSEVTLSSSPQKRSRYGAPQLRNFQS